MCSLLARSPPPGRWMRPLTYLESGALTHKKENSGCSRQWYIHCSLFRLSADSSVSFIRFLARKSFCARFVHRLWGILLFVPVAQQLVAYFRVTARVSAVSRCAFSLIDADRPVGAILVSSYLTTRLYKIIVNNASPLSGVTLQPSMEKCNCFVGYNSQYLFTSYGTDNAIDHLLLEYVACRVLDLSFRSGR